MALDKRFVAIDGSAGKSCNALQLDRVHKTVSAIVRRLLEAGAGVVVSIGSEPRTDESVPETARVFYWTVLSAARDWGRSRTDTPVDRVRIVCSQQSRTQVPEAREELLLDILTTGLSSLRTIEANWNAGAIVRQAQAECSDAQVVIGGGEGVEHLTMLHMERGKPVIPLDADIGSGHNDGNGGSVALNRLAMAKPERFVEADPVRLPGMLDVLSFRHPQCDPEAIAGRTVEALGVFVRPRAFCVRLLDSDSTSHRAVERYFRTVVSKVLHDQFDLELITVGVTPPLRGLINAEIFERLHRAAFVVADLTDLRPNCFLELGYSLGRGIPTIVSAMDGTKLPFDTQAIPTFFWSATATARRLRTDFANHWQLHSARPRIVEPRFLPAF